MPEGTVSPTFHQSLLSYTQRLDKRCTDEINLLVIHCTELPDLATARVYGEQVHHPETQTGNSGHFYIDRDGSIEQWVPLNRVAHHVRGFNLHSIGVELVNRGRSPNWYHSGQQVMSEPYPDSQIEALVSLVEYLQTQLGGLERIAGHEDLDTGLIASQDRPETMIRRKLDPGPLFPWSALMDNVPLRRFYAKDS